MTTGFQSPLDEKRGSRHLLLKIPGKESFLALVEIAATMPTRPWFARYPKEKAEREADLVAWSPAQVRQFNDRLERTPRNHAELAELAVMRLLDLKDNLENGDTSNAQILLESNEEAIRNYIGNALREAAAGRYTIPQEEELADAKRPDLRFQGNGFDGPVPVELKIANAGWSGPKLFERMENQLCGDYLRDTRSARGIFVLVYQGGQKRWRLPDGSFGVFADLVKALQDHWTELSLRFPDIDEIAVIGIDLTIRGQRPPNAAI